jgi:type II secretory ATPase GspE/PulE/Tfp pilus assembly ATPase PilB-like protein
VVEETTEEKEEVVEEKTIFDINITSITDLISYTIKKEYDFFIIEPSEEKVKISFRKDNTEKEVKYVKYSVYSKIILKAKSVTKLKVDETEKSQE